jgi:tRNA A-37 threonylcarbamoyl transferase component Bud32/formylglycine-generating enzyme required for sulfatase activity
LSKDPTPRPAQEIDAAPTPSPAGIGADETLVADDFQTLDSLEAQLAEMIDAQDVRHPLDGATAPEPLAPGTLLDGRYEIERVLGTGGYGTVYLALQKSTGQRVAIKVMHPTQGVDAAVWELARARFKREMNLIGQLDHPHVVRLIDAGSLASGTLFTVLAFIEGQTLADLLHDRGPMTMAQVKPLMMQVADALASAHALGIVHRDLKPQNIMVRTIGARQHAMIVDFGISAVAPDARDPAYETLTRESTFCGTPPYMAPEQLRDHPTTRQADIYAWGLVFLECLQGRPVFAAASTAEIIHAQLSDRPVTLPPELAATPMGDLLAGAVAKPLDVRATDAGALYQQLEEMPAGKIDDPAPRRRRTAAKVAAAAALVATAAFVWAWSGPSADQDQSGTAASPGTLVGADGALERVEPRPAVGRSTSAAKQRAEVTRRDTPDAVSTLTEGAPNAQSLGPTVKLPARVGPMGLPEAELKALRSRFPSNAVDLYVGTGLLPFVPQHAQGALEVMKYEVSAKQWHGVAPAVDEVTRACSDNAPTSAAAPGPMGLVGATEAATFCAAHQMRLPTAHEWEAVARGVKGRLFALERLEESLGMTLTPSELAALAEGPTVPAWSQTPDGIVGLTGGVSEWVTCESATLEYCVDGYAHRGGSHAFRTLSARPEPGTLLAPLVNVLGAAPQCLRRSDIGFRCVRSL